MLLMVEEGEVRALPEISVALIGQSEGIIRLFLG